MTPEAQQIAIAEACGWIRTNDWASGWMIKTDNWPRGIPGTLPDYFNDLNAMHQVEKILNADQLEQHRNHLAQIEGSFMHAINADASVRAEAFLRTINKWID